jgi:hypothetical protein
MEWGIAPRSWVMSFMSFPGGCTAARTGSCQGWVGAEQGRKSRENPGEITVGSAMSEGCATGFTPRGKRLRAYAKRYRAALPSPVSPPRRDDPEMFTITPSMLCVADDRA